MAIEFLRPYLPGTVASSFSNIPEYFGTSILACKYFDARNVLKQESICSLVDCVYRKEENIANSMICSEQLQESWKSDVFML